ncbi:MAG: hypothetical protein VKL42_12580 [Snowella sp.]|nr:hypothetical protein [Snowella sp.]
MTTVIVSGSRKVPTRVPLPKEVTDSLDKIMELGFDIVIGDAEGIDTQVQWYLRHKDYTKVTVYYAVFGNTTKPRNNYGFPTIAIEGFYSRRDKTMCAIADYGLAIWNGQSKGTLENIKRVPKTKVIRV